ncbi:MAG TPA: pentapeptide repeat-containing protein [Paraburkholderia sp.]|uniref:pentapeptide repeat-containing protein n=1 Tax=Paraburkholderia sp. TaxID=1926495 RepID=UPI002B465E7B|nr:pentapeptide repeat-containing protein [Paraburkholderia sp.]HKR45421.1 pentapeptide repeat-containing protein [Paraburkholderia sp.]
MIRKTLRKPSARKPPRREWKRFTDAREHLHLWVDLLTMLASIATVVTLYFLLQDRPKQENITAWTLLQGYLQSATRSEFNQGQGFAMQSLAKNKIPLEFIKANGIHITGADLRKADFDRAEFRQATFDKSNLAGASFIGAVLQGASIDQCGDCENITFRGADLSDAHISNGDLSGTSFDLADISGLEFSDVTLDELAIGTACFRRNNPPRFWHKVDGKTESYVPANLVMPMDPQGELCVQGWGKSWGVS